MPLFALRLLLVVIALRIAPAASLAQRTGKADVKASSGPDATSRPKPLTARERATARRAAKQKETRDAWLAKLKQRNVEPWPETDADKDHEAALAESRSMVSEVIRLFPGSQLHETEHFLFVSNIPPQQIGPYILSLDRMYDWMCHLYGVPRDHMVWLGGKAPIFAFLDHDQFEAFEDRFFPEAKESLHTLSNIYGLSHLKENGEVVISCFRGENANDFGQMLVHETSHGFIHRYKTKARLPNWVDEGMAELIGAEMVPASAAVKNREYRAAQELAQRGSMGGMLEAERIEAWQYGVASSLNRFLLQQNRDSYVRFIEALKDGQKWDEALRGAYRRSPEELLTAYSRWVNVANLRP
jgi:hypothetical protein